MNNVVIPEFDLDYREKELNEWSILHMYRGSVAHGMYVPSEDPLSIDDVDTLNICVPPLDYYFGLKEYGSRGTHEIKRGKWDIVSYELRKFIFLLEEGNPNVLYSLWCDSKYFIRITEPGQMILDNRNLFLAKNKVYAAFAGYAAGQLYKMEHQAYEGYMGEKRKGLVNLFGYDTKNASHCIRLLRMAKEFFTSGDMVVDRSGVDAEELLAIKHGEWSIEAVKALSEELFFEVKQARDKSGLPEYPDKEAVNKLCMNVVLHKTYR